MASLLMLPVENPLDSHMAQLHEMEIETIGLIKQCSLLQQTKQHQITDAKSQINTYFNDIINTFKTKQNQFILELDTIINDTIHSEQSILSSITTIINEQKQYLSQYIQNDPNFLSHHQIDKINQDFNASKHQYLSHLTSIQKSISIDDNKISQILDRVKKKKQFKQTFPANKTSLANNIVYSRLQTTIQPRNTFYYQYVSDPLIPLVSSINILTEYIPNKIIQTLFSYLPNLPPQFDVTNYLINGWEVSDEILHDYPDVYVENVLPIQNQPSLILTIGLPGSGKTTWAKIRNKQNINAVIAADDYFDKFNNGDFNVTLLGQAHEWAQFNVENALRSGCTVVANNTNTTLSEMHTYVSKVVFGELPHKIVFAIMPETNVHVLIKRGIHGVPPRKIMEMLKRMDYWLIRGPPSIHSVLKAGGFRKFKDRKRISRDVIYTGIFMDRLTQEQIRRYFVSISGKPMLCHDTDCHLTLKYQPFYEDVDMLPFGKKVKLKLVGYATHEYIQCFMVDILDESVSQFCVEYPHITVSLNKSYVRPNYSNDLLSNGKVIPIINNFDVGNSMRYNELYRNVNRKDDANGGLIVEGTVGGFLRNPTSGVYLERPMQLQYESNFFNRKYQSHSGSRFGR